MAHHSGVCGHGVSRLICDSCGGGGVLCLMCRVGGAGGGAPLLCVPLLFAYHCCGKGENCLLGKSYCHLSLGSRGGPLILILGY